MQGIRSGEIEGRLHFLGREAVQRITSSLLRVAHVVKLEIFIEYLSDGKIKISFARDFSGMFFTKNNGGVLS